MSQNDLSWSSYYAVMRSNPPRPYLIRTLEMLEERSIVPGFALDLGSGAGQDTHEMLRRGWRVLAIDKEEEGLNILRSVVPPELSDRLQTQIMTFEQLALPPADLINASYSLPFCQPDYFDAMWQTITVAVRSGGWFSGNFFGVRDQWADTPTVTFHTEEKARGLFVDFDIEVFDEFEGIAPTACRGDKHWHTFTVIARKR
jgi:SAM-dependent methyltransferase